MFRSWLENRERENKRTMRRRNTMKRGVKGIAMKYDYLLLRRWSIAAELILNKPDSASDGWARSAAVAEKRRVSVMDNRTPRESAGTLDLFETANPI